MNNKISIITATLLLALAASLFAETEIRYRTMSDSSFTLPSGETEWQYTGYDVYIYAGQNDTLPIALSKNGISTLRQDYLYRYNLNNQLVDKHRIEDGKLIETLKITYDDSTGMKLSELSVFLKVPLDSSAAVDTTSDTLFVTTLYGSQTYKTEYAYDEKNNLKTMSSYNWQTDAFVLSQKMTINYVDGTTDTASTVMAGINPNSGELEDMQKATVTYDSNSRIKRIDYEFLGFMAPIFKPQASIYEWDGDKLMLRTSQRTINDTLTDASKYTFEYDSAGREISYKKEKLDQDLGIWQDSETYISDYDENGNLISYTRDIASPSSKDYKTISTYEDIDVPVTARPFTGKNLDPDIKLSGPGYVINSHGEHNLTMVILDLKGREVSRLKPEYQNDYAVFDMSGPGVASIRGIYLISIQRDGKTIFNDRVQSTR